MKNKLSLALTLALIAAMLVTSLALADDTQTDGDILVPSSNPSVSDCTVAHTFSGASTIKYSGSEHFANGATLIVTVSADSGITASGPASITLPNPWGKGDQYTFSGLSTNVPAGVTTGTYKVYVSVSGAKASIGTLTVGDFFNVNVTCATTPTNTPPAIAADNTSVTVDEGDTAYNSGTYSDADGDDVTLSASVGAITDNLNGTWSWSFDTTDGPDESQEVTITADDGNGGVSTATFNLTVNNVAPTVEKPAFALSSINCQASVNLTGISFNDPGVNDADWIVNIDWGDGSTDTNYSTATQGAQNDQSHVYSSGGTFTATVTVMDKDSGEGSNTSSNTITVIQYALDFLPPFDDSTPSGLIVNKMKNGRVVPVKVTIYDYCTAAYLTNPNANVTIKVTKTSGTAGTIDPIEEYADAGQSSAGTNAFRWADDFWIYNLDSKALGLVVNNFYRVDVYVGAVKATINNWAVLQPVK